MEKVQFHGDVVQAGFYREVSSLWPDLKRLIDNKPRNPIVFAGHSRGGALAVLTALHLEKDDKNDHRIDFVLTAGATVGSRAEARMKN